MAEASKTGSHMEVLRINMISRLTQTDAHFKHQQRGERDLTSEEKAAIAKSILEKSSVLFLERFSKFLSLEDVQCFRDERKDYSVTFYLEEIEQRCKDKKHNIVKNRRYKALQELIDKGEYFSEEEMKWRDPLLFEQMVGQYIDESEKTERDEADIDKSDVRFSTILLKHMDVQTSKEYYNVLKEREEEQLEESEDESEEDEMEEDDSHAADGAYLGSGNENEITDFEKNHMRGEFLRIMQERFLAGEDKEFDYGQVDSNTDYDSMDILEHDAEEKYFDKDDEEDEDTKEVTINQGGQRFDDVSERLAGVDLDKTAETAVAAEETPNSKVLQHCTDGGANENVVQTERSLTGEDGVS